MVNTRQWNLYQLLGWPEWISGRDLAKAYKEKVGREISYGALYVNMRYLVEWDFAEKLDEDEDGRVRFLYRKNARGSRPEKPTKLTAREDQRDGVGIILPERT